MYLKSLLFLSFLFFVLPLSAQQNEEEYFDTPDLPSNGFAANIGSYLSHKELYLSYERAIWGSYGLSFGVSILGNNYRPGLYSEGSVEGKGLGGFLETTYFLNGYAFEKWYVGLGSHIKKYNLSKVTQVYEKKGVWIFTYSGFAGYRFLFSKKFGLNLGARISSVAALTHSENFAEYQFTAQPIAAVSYHF